MSKGHHVAHLLPYQPHGPHASLYFGISVLTPLFSIGRITRDLLLSLSTTIDIVEPIQKFTSSLTSLPGIGDIYNVGLESFTPKEGISYDLIWNQWCVGHLTDLQLSAYLRKCGSLLAKDEEGKVTGLVIVKENLAPVVDVFDEEDSSVTRFALPPLSLLFFGSVEVVGGEG